MFHDIPSPSRDALYTCGEAGPGTGSVLCYWNGQAPEELNLPVEEAALTRIYVENRKSVWICGRVGGCCKAVKRTSACLCNGRFVSCGA
ncbi:hypothetical protein [Paracoccus alkenifer]|uniref:hypothetical protein n=1 Tax=Paracoccus alkenifer TaxID=65735 RepID=UPI001C432991|nr:hypothetical protein [Paracoccus alkenifer]